MRHALASDFPLIDDQSIATRQALFFSNFFCGIEQVRVIAGIGELRKSRRFFTSYDDDVNGRLRIDVTKSDDVLVLIHDVSRDFAVDDLREEGRHGCVLP